MAVQTGSKQGPASSELQPTPAPTQRSTSWGRENYGSNGYAGKVSDNPGQRTRAGLTVNHDDSDPVLAEVRAKGTARVDSEITGQLRSIADRNVPTHPSMSAPNNSARVPDKIGGGLETSQPVRKPTA
jgi:hypothetical protein